MKVDELIIDGFKSYATRTVISGWDPSFNCITGLNGSGKSNVLDAICFVLGITTMSTVRAQNLQDLIYKRGQAGVTKASVTIVFDNTDRAKSPIGFEDQSQISITRQIVLGGTSKFLINGHRAQQQTVQQLFQSVQLNINNPNFLIMQGRITKVLNMKATEILSLIEEAAGTRMFEDRREKAIKTMTKKEKKVEEILGLLNDEIEPKLENLRNEKRTFLEYQQTQSGLERMEKLVGAYDYVRYTEKAKSECEVLETKRARLQDTQQAVDKTKNELKNLEQEIKALRKQKEDQIQKGGRFQALEKKVKEITQELARINTLIELKTANIEEEQTKKEEVSKQIEGLKEKISQGSNAFHLVQQDYEQARSRLEEHNQQYSKKEELLRSLQTGVSSKGDEGGYASQLQEARNTVNQAQTASAQAKVRVEYLEKLIKEEAPKTKKAEKENEGLLSNVEEMKKEVGQYRTKMEQAGWVPGKIDELVEKESGLAKEVKTLSDELETMKRKISKIDFNYSKPSADFNPASVKGVVAQLFTVDKKNYKGATALEVCAASRLFNVVVDTDETASKLLQHGKLKRRVTIIPLNQIAAFRLSAEKLGAAQKIAPGKVDLALNLIGYEADVMKAMEYVFGSTMVCNDADSAKKVTFDPKIRCTTVTLDGDIYDPKGTLSGGSSAESGGLLVTMQKYNELNTRYKDKKGQLDEVRVELAAERELMAKCKDIKKQMDLKEHEIKLATEQLENSASANVLKAYKERTEEIGALKQQIADDERAIKEGSTEVEKIERDMQEFKGNKGGKLQQLKKAVEQLEKDVEQQNEQVRNKLVEYQNAQVSTGQLDDDLATAQEQEKEIETAIGELKNGLEDLRWQYKKAESSEQEALTALEEEKATLVGIDDELGEYETLFASKTKFATENGLECQKMTHEVDKLAKDVEQYRAGIKSLEEEYEWIQDQEQYFGKPGTAYDFENVNIKECRANLKRLRERIKGMKNNVNSKVMNMIENVEKKEASLKSMIQTIEKDKHKIEETIISLDEYKREALVKTWGIVSEEFGKIFADLLPGGFSKLVPPEGKDVTEGLEVKVSLGNVWKESLAELSGGQRSLIALSLILALMKFKPAPMYILDEVDAALDLHHTQNVGLMIKNRFANSQFIVVSLKDGLFQSANRVFRARFQDGTSTVSAM